MVRNKSLWLIFILFVSILFVSGLVVASDDWPMLYHDSNHTGFTTAEGLRNVSDVDSISFKCCGAKSSSPAVVNGYVYIGGEIIIDYIFPKIFPDNQIEIQKK